MKYLLPIVFLLLIAGAACNTTGCLDNRNAIPRAAFYSSENGQQVSLSTLMVWGIGTPNDSVLLESGNVANELYLPMRSEHSSVQWCFHYTQSNISGLENNDTITLDYTSTPYFASAECGASYRYNITRCHTTTHLIDSVVVIDSLITNVDMVRIGIYLRTAQAEEPDEEA